MPNLLNAGQLASYIIKMAENDVADLGATDAAQKSYIYPYLNMAMWELARLAYNVKFSDALTISSNGYVTFKQSTVNITDMYEPMAIYNASDSPVQKRTAYDAPTGWWRESNNLEIHVKGLTAGAYTLKYLKYPATVSLDADTIEFPPSGYLTLAKKVISLIKYSKNSYGGAEYMDGQATKSMPAAAQGTISSRGTGSTGQPVGPADVAIARGQ